MSDRISPQFAIPTKPLNLLLLRRASKLRDLGSKFDIEAAIKIHSI